MTSTTPEGKKSGRAKKPKPRKRIQEVVSYAIAHRTRVQILVVLNEGTFAPGEIAEIIDKPLNTVANHVRELADAGSIELVKTEKRRNVNVHFYRAVEIPFYSDEETAALTPQEREMIAGLFIQGAIAEVMAAFWAGKLRNDPQIIIAWDWFNLDALGRAELAEEQARSWKRIQDIEINALNRSSKSGEQTRSMLVTSFGYERARTAPKTTLPHSRNCDSSRRGE